MVSNSVVLYKVIIHCQAIEAMIPCLLHNSAGSLVTALKQFLQNNVCMTHWNRNTQKFLKHESDAGLFTGMEQFLSGLTGPHEVMTAALWSDSMDMGQGLT